MMKIVIASFVLISMVSPVRASEFSCPTKAPTKTKAKQSVMGKVAGWEAFDDTQVVSRLDKVDFYDGHPQKMVQLAPDNPNSTEDPAWSFGSTGVEVWMACRYTRTSVALVKKLPAGLKSCVVKYSKDNPPQVSGISCR